MAASALPPSARLDTCMCPRLYLFPYHDDIGKPSAIEVNLCQRAPNSNLKKPIVWVLGGPGSGKGVQCEKIIDKYSFSHLSTGRLLRAEMEGKTARAPFITAIMEQGDMVSNEVCLELLKEAIHKPTDTKGFLVDGYPREKAQAVAFEKVVASPSAILFFEASDETLTQRLLRRGATSGRPDDNEVAIKQRLKHYHETRQALLDQYPCKVARISAEYGVDDIFAEVEKVLDPIVHA
ncbi:hypothetical protein PYW08_001281 [Mythimna loreyi]|uniref:Uncharacterized protein n=1 Tax=Mythimna loreyi TaxID=667449 RepID=A0ACC2R0X4_9NEOP|nr:hypothetical protein PYW08_001281 [Mythimna loreyi]